MSKNKIAYGASVNLAGLYSSKPIKMKWDEELQCYWDKSGNFSAEGMDTINMHGNITFTSYNKQEVEIWLSGAKAVMELLRDWAIVEP